MVRPLRRGGRADNPAGRTPQQEGNHQAEVPPVPSRHSAEATQPGKEQVGEGVILYAKDGHPLLVVLRDTDTDETRSMTAEEELELERQMAEHYANQRPRR